MNEDKRKKELADLCDPKKQIWNPFGEYSDIGVERKAEQIDSLTRFINSCSPNIRGQEIIDSRTGKYVRYSGGKNREAYAQEPNNNPQNTGQMPDIYEL